MSKTFASKTIRAARVVAFADLGMEAIHEFIVEDMPVTVAVDSEGHSVHETGPLEWRRRIGTIPVKVVSEFWYEVLSWRRGGAERDKAL